MSAARSDAGDEIETAPRRIGIRHLRRCPRGGACLRVRRPRRTTLARASPLASRQATPQPVPRPSRSRLHPRCDETRRVWRRDACGAGVFFEKPCQPDAIPLFAAPVMRLRRLHEDSSIFDDGKPSFRVGECVFRVSLE